MKETVHDRRTREFYSQKKVAEEYDDIRFTSPGGRAVNRRQFEALAAVLPLCKRKKVLDVGCGTGRISQFLARQGANVTGLDSSREMINVSKKRYPSITFKHGNALHLPFNGESFDLGVSVAVYNHMASYEKAIDELCRVSQKVVLGLPNKHSLLLLSYLYRLLRTGKLHYTTADTKKFGDVHQPYGLFFPRREIIRILRKNNFKKIKWTGALLLSPLFLPNFGAKIWYTFDKLLSPVLKPVATFHVFSAERV